MLSNYEFIFFKYTLLIFTSGEFELIKGKSGYIASDN